MTLVMFLTYWVILFCVAMSLVTTVGATWYWGGWQFWEKRPCRHTFVAYYDGICCSKCGENAPRVPVVTAPLEGGTYRTPPRPR